MGFNERKNRLLQIFLPQFFVVVVAYLSCDEKYPVTYFEGVGVYSAQKKNGESYCFFYLNEASAPTTRFIRYLQHKNIIYPSLINRWVSDQYGT